MHMSKLVKSYILNMCIFLYSHYPSTQLLKYAFVTEKPRKHRKVEREGKYFKHLKATSANVMENSVQLFPLCPVCYLTRL